jgi:deferrochelatase/peroxidase EfeB
MSQPDAELHDIQAMVRSGLGRLTEVLLLLLRVTDPAAARAWLRDAPVTAVADLAQHRDTVLQVALTAPGLAALGLDDAALRGFSDEFLEGMGEEARARRLGDVDDNAPARWAWGRPGDEPHVLALLYAEPGKLAGWRDAVATAAFRAGFAVALEFPSSGAVDREPFGFADGISQPTLDWSRRRTPGTNADLEYGNLIAPGEFLLGYPNEYGHYTPGPVLAPDTPGAAALAEAPDRPGWRDLGRNGSYLVLRHLDQDVPGFWRFMAAQNSALGMVGLAEMMVGRGINGEPRIAGAGRDIAGVDAKARGRNGFTYEADLDGLACPFGAHVRRANPRTGDMPGGRQGLISQLVTLAGLRKDDPRDDVVAASRFHRILRRGRRYGPELSPEQAVAPDAPDEPRGLQFICLNANISRQFEFVQNAWLQGPHFAGLDGETDPLLGTRGARLGGGPADRFSAPQAGGPAMVVRGLPQFVTLRGGGYFFLPSLRAIRFLAGPG